MENLIPDPFKNYEMKGNKPQLPGSPSAKPKPKDVIRNMTKDDLRTLALEKISEALQSVDATLEPELAIKIANAALDRIDGKPAQAVTMVSTVNVNLMAQEMQDNARLEVNEALRLLSLPTIDN